MAGRHPDDDDDDDVDVLVVGAGPTGLMLTNWLVKLGVRVALVDSKEGPTTESRALGVHSRSMEIYDQLGVIDRVLAEAVRAESMRQGFGRRAFAPVPLTGLGEGITPYPGVYVLDQSANERILTENLLGIGASVRWRHRLTALEQVDGGVHGVVHGPVGPAGARTVRARFAVGCDGASSSVRSFCGIAFTGTTSRRTFYLVDAVGVRGLAPASVNIRQGATEFLLAFPMKPDGTGRNGQRLIGLAGDDDVTEEFARHRLAEGFGVTYEDHRWFSAYRVHHRIAERFRTGAVFLAGDAAHVHSPVGAQGMNTGLQDAHNLAFKLAAVLTGAAPETFLDRYEEERRPVAQRLLRTTDVLFNGITTRSRTAALIRKYVPRVALPIGVALLPRLPLGRRLAGYLGQIRIHYRMDGSSPRRRRDAVVGRRLLWTGENFGVLRDAAWQLHLYAPDAAVGREAETAAQSLGLPLHTFATTGSTALEPGILYLVRPDGFVAGSSGPQDAVVAFAGTPGLPAGASSPTPGCSSGERGGDQFGQ